MNTKKFMTLYVTFYDESRAINLFRVELNLFRIKKAYKRCQKFHQCAAISKIKCFPVFHSSDQCCIEFALYSKGKQKFMLHIPVGSKGGELLYLRVY